MGTETIHESMQTAAEGPWDVVVAGAGAAGICAAIAAARTGARALLLDSVGCVGGTASLGLPWAQFTDGAGRQIVRGIAEEILDRLRRAGALSRDPATDRFIDVDNELYKIFAIQMLQEAGVEVRLHTHLCGAARTGASIDAAIVEAKRGRRALRGRVFVDATGDGDLSAMAGADFTKGRADGKMQSATVLFSVGGVNDKAFLDWGGNVSMVEAWTRIAPGSKWRNPKKHTTQLAWMTQVGNRPGEWYINHTRIINVDATSEIDLTRAEMEGRLQALEVVEEFLRPHVRGFERCFISQLAPRVGVRETRHIAGDYTMTVRDVMEFRKFADAIACHVYAIDIHDPTGAGQVDNREHFEAHAGDYYQIPYRCLTPPQIDNLLVAGRCISADHEAAASFRPVAGCMAIGQAAGVAAGLCIRENTTPRRLDAQKVRRALREQGAWIEP